MDKEVIIARLAKLEESLKELGELAKLSEKDFLDSWKNRRLAERCVEIAAQTSIDIANHLVASIGLRAPQGYADVFQILGEASILTDELVESMKQIAGLRNILIHEYLRIEHNLLFGYLQDTSAFKEFAKSILKHIS